MLKQTSQMDSGWDWILKRLTMVASSYEHYAVECEGMTEGLMIIETDFRRVRERRRLNLVYVEWIAVAPWNRPSLTDKPKYRRTGSILLHRAATRSYELGFKYRVGLHSVQDPETEGFYRKCGMRDCGIDPRKEFALL